MVRFHLPAGRHLKVAIVFEAIVAATEYVVFVAIKFTTAEYLLAA